jgi:hypothetical protein
VLDQLVAISIKNTKTTNLTSHFPSLQHTETPAQNVPQA